MVEPTRMWLKPTVPGGGWFDLHEVRDELFMDLTDGTGTHHLATTCYGVAVKECFRIGIDYYILKVRTDLIGILLTELRSSYKVSRLHTLADKPGSRLLLTDKMMVRFVPGTPVDERRSCLEKYCGQFEGDHEIPDGIFLLDGKFLNDPVSAWRAAELESTILRAAPVVLTIPLAIEEEAVRVDLTGIT